MLSAALIAVLAAAPVDVLVVLPSSAHEAVSRATPKGRTFVDASALYEHLLAPVGMLDFQDFAAFTEPPIAGWPSELQEPWTTGTTYCREIAGPAPWRQSLPGGRCCGRRLGLYLWDRYLASVKANEVFIVRTFPQNDTVGVRGTRSTREGLDELVVEKEGPAADQAKLIAEVVAKLFAKEGTRAKRTVVQRLFVPEPGDPWTQASAPVPFELKKRCDQLPARLTFKSQSATSKALQARWEAASKGAAADLECSLQFSSHDELPEEMMPMPMTVVTTVLRCGDVVVSNELARSSLVKAPLDAVSAGLAQSLAARLCR